MTAESPQSSRRMVSACPWCGSGTPLTFVGDGMGSIALTCTACGCKGPPMPIEGDFKDADERALSRWSHRARAARRTEPDTLQRIERAIAVQRILHEELHPEACVPIRLSDLQKLMHAAA